MIRKFYASLLVASALAGAAPALAQDGGDVAAELAKLRAQVETLQARVTELEDAKTAGAPQPQAKREPGPEISFRGAPTITAPGGWSFKPRGRLLYDVGHVSSPNGISNPGLGFGNEVRRARLGVEGTIPGGFGYLFEVDFADNNVLIPNAFLTYRASKTIGLTIGQHNNFQSLEELTSTNFTSFIERAAFTDAFNFEHHLGVSGTWTSGDFIAQAGVFTDNIQDLRSDANNAVGVDGRLVFAPKLDKNTQLHLGASGHWRDAGDVAGTGVRYRQRPLVHTTDVRFLATPSLNIDGETHYGVEAALIRGPFHAAAEAHWLDVDMATPGLSPTLFGGYAEVGYFLTGETRGYRGGNFGRTRVRHPVGGKDGGIGAFQVNLRYDRLDLVSDGIVGGTQDGLQASLIWIPTDYVRFMLNYGHMIYDDAAIPAADGDRSYSVDVIGARSQIDF